MRGFWIVLITVVTVLGGVLAPGVLSVSAHPTKSPLPILHLAGGKQAPTDMVNAGLVRLQPSGKVVPDLATWTVSPDHLTYTFTIRPTARFSNGHAVTARDAAFSVARYLTPSFGQFYLPYLQLIRGAAAFNAGTTRTLSGVSVVDPRTLRIEITKPVGYFLSALAGYSAVLDRSVVAGKPLGNPNDFFKSGYMATTCTGNQGAGPLMFVCRDRSSTPHSFYSGRVPTFTLMPNPYYYGRKPSIGIQFRYYGKGTAFYSAYVEGKVDVIYGIPAPYIIRWKGKSAEFRKFPTSNIIYFTPNVHLAPFDNLHCRLAAAYAIDRSTEINKVLGGAERPTYAVVPKGMLGYYAGKDNPHYDLKRARSELAKCPGRTSPIDLTYPDLGRDSQDAREFMVHGLAAAGFNIKLRLVSPDDWFKIVAHPLDQSKTQFTFNGWSQDYPDPQDYCSLLLRSGQPFNIGGWRNSTYDRLVDQADVLINRKKRAALYIRAQHIALSEGAFISLSNQYGFALIKPYVHGMVGGEANSGLGPKKGDWANVSISPH